MPLLNQSWCIDAHPFISVLDCRAQSHDSRTWYGGSLHFDSFSITRTEQNQWWRTAPRAYAKGILAEVQAIHALHVAICSGTNHWPMRQIVAQVVAPLTHAVCKILVCLFLLTSSRPYYINLMLAWWKVFLWKYRKIKPFDIATTSWLKLWDFSYSVSLWFVCESEELVTKNKENIRIIAKLQEILRNSLPPSSSQKHLPTSF